MEKQMFNTGDEVLILSNKSNAIITDVLNYSKLLFLHSVLAEKSLDKKLYGFEEVVKVTIN